jgi:hypothetical protein
MANVEHLALLQAGAVQWIEWRKTYPQIEPDLSAANLQKKQPQRCEPPRSKLK